MKSELKKWGNSLAVRLPKPVAEAAGLRMGDVVELVPRGKGKVEMRSAVRRPSLAELVERITPENLHPETKWGPPRGREEW